MYVPFVTLLLLYILYIFLFILNFLLNFLNKILPCKKKNPHGDMLGGDHHTWYM